MVEDQINEELPEIESPKKKTRQRNPGANEHKVYEHLRSLENPPGFASFHEIQSALEMTPGALQATIKRLLGKEDYPIFESSMISSTTNRKVRIFSWTPNYLPEPEDVIDTQLYSGKMIDTPDKMGKILPLEIDNETVEILNHLIKSVSDYSNMGELFSFAITEYLGSIPNALIMQALNKTKTGDIEHA